MFATLLALALPLLQGQGIEVRAEPTGQRPDLKPQTASYMVQPGDVEFCIDLKLEYFATGKIVQSLPEVCSNSCRGTTYYSHKECKATCDKACTAIHQGVLKVIDSTYLNFGSLKAQVLADMQKFGGQPAKLDGFPWSDAWVYEQNTPMYKYKLKHWVNASCSTSFLAADCDTYNVDVTYQLWRKENGVRVDGPKFQATVGKLMVPNGTMHEEPPHLACTCDGSTPDYKKHPFIWSGYYDPKYPTSSTNDGGSLPKEPPSAPGGSGIKIGLLPDSPLAPRQEMVNASLTFSCPDVITAQVTSPGWTGGPDGFTLSPGTILEPDDDRYQEMILLDELKLLRDINVVLPVDPSKPKVIVIGRKNQPVAAGKVSGYADCLEMHKEQPDGSVKYHPLVSNSPVLDRLAYMASKELIRGPWIQARFWIATDNATYDEMSKVLIPMPSKAKYLESMYVVATVGGVDFANSPERRCLDVHQLSWGVPADGVGLWLVRTLSEVDPKALADYVSNNLKDFDYLFDPDITEDDYDYAAELAYALCTDDDPRVRRAGLDFLAHIPAQYRAGVADHDGLLGLNRILMSGDSSDVSKALGVTEQYLPKCARLGLLNMNPSMTKNLKMLSGELLQRIPE